MATLTDYHRRLFVRAAEALEWQAGHIEEMGCTCVDNTQYEKFHAPNRRRRDSRCTGVSLAVKHRRVIKQLRKAAKSRVL